MHFIFQRSVEFTNGKAGSPSFNDAGALMSVSNRGFIRAAFQLCELEYPQHNDRYFIITALGIEKRSAGKPNQPVLSEYLLCAQEISDLVTCEIV